MNSTRFLNTVSNLIALSGVKSESNAELNTIHFQFAVLDQVRTVLVKIGFEEVIPKSRNLIYKNTKGTELLINCAYTPEKTATLFILKYID